MLLLFILACGSPEPPAPPPPPAPVEAVEAPAFPEPAKPSDKRYAASHILVAWRGAAKAPARVEREQAEAEALAKELFAKLQDGADFETLAKAHSDGPSAPRGGRLGTYLTGTMVPTFEAAVAGVEVGAYTLAESPFGWHVIRRDPVEHVAIQHIVIGYAGAHESTATRTREEADALITEIQQRLAAGESFDAVAAEVNEDASKATAGHLGGFGRGQMVPAFEDAAFALAPGATSKVVETPYGLHILKRLE
ncbi:MAG: hypothetical protein EP330_12110 [Deltaproteobacteria bacterium]|nr:MAG: hypothetical protein EP330_12110 [Deltaproteobacteria bacterium]